MNGEHIILFMGAEIQVRKYSSITLNRWCGPWSTPWVLIRNARSLFPPQTYGVTLHLTRSQVIYIHIKVCTQSGIYFFIVYGKKALDVLLDIHDSK